MEKTVYFFIDDVIWVMRDLTRKRPKSLFDNEFMKMLKKAHDDNGLKVQLNLFYRTDFFYGSDEFTLSEMTDVYKKEFEEASDWLKLAFHAKQEFPDYPYVNANYEDVKKDYETIINEIKRFAGENLITDAVVPHWLPLSKDACRALKDCGVRITSSTEGDKFPYVEGVSILPYGHAARLKQNKKPETMVFKRISNDPSITDSICGFNHVSNEENDKIWLKNASIKNEETGIRFKHLCNGLCLNLFTMQEMKEKLDELMGSEYIGIGNHEQYFYSDYFNYQPDYAEKIYTMSKILKEKGYSFITGEEIK